ncbi:MAG: 30S ribosome-binding factor RbfA [Deltaproteobacteria bacterium]|nr:30S ribosome-binding factor RbfA [Deltaproteobacteria bacterium]MBW2070782.1 30S ribosome-binding factor RbfA [Deltaproteobacteria bacterium]
MVHRRADRVADLILRELAEILIRRVKDPRLGNITITQVLVSKDLRYAKVYYSVLAGDEERQQVVAGLQSARGFVKRELGKRLRLRRMPDIAFFLDTSFDQGALIQRLLTDLNRPEYE